MSNLPATGYFTVREWAEAFEVTEQQFRHWIARYQIPYFKPGRCMIIQAEDFWACVPRVTHGE